jgi:hypothetical protein
MSVRQLVALRTGQPVAEKNGLFNAAAGTHLLVNRRPHFGDPWACGVNDLHAAVRQQAHFLNGGTKRRQDDNIPFFYLRKVLLVILHLDKLNVHRRHPLRVGHH